MSLSKTITFNDGNKMPQIGLGSWLSKPGEVENAVVEAVKAGYRHLDLAKIYQNQHEVGAALKKLIPSVVKREDLFITSKLWNTEHQPDRVEPALDDTLKELGIDYLDLYLIHWPVAFDPSSGELLPKEDGKAKLDLKTTEAETCTSCPVSTSRTVAPTTRSPACSREPERYSVPSKPFSPICPVSFTRVMNVDDVWSAHLRRRDQEDRLVSQTMKPMISARPAVQMNRPSETGPSEPRARPPGEPWFSMVFR